uniref:Protein CASC3 n=1 Tax=Anthurium amnicola TaxID=1678845 RepID=A0A1D1Y3R5_9ARAE
MAEASSSATASAPVAEEEEPEYESDPEDALLPSAMRRREASDDEEEAERSDGNGHREPARAARRISRVGSDEDLDGQGGAPAYEDEEEFEPEEEEDVEEDSEEDGEELLEEEVEVVGYGDGDECSQGGDAGRAEIPVDGVDSERDGQRSRGETGDYRVDDRPEEERKESEPFAVPTAGAFYMHDDRFRENGGGRHSRTKGGRKLWESRDDRKWVHDRFEEMNIQDARKEERTSKGRFRGRGRPRGPDRGYLRGNRPPSYDDRPRAYDGRLRAYRNDRSRAYDDGGNQNIAPKSVRGRGSRKYESLPKINGEQPATQHKQTGKSHDVASNNNVPRQSSSMSNAQHGTVHPQKHIFASSLNSASPPFYPSGSSTQDISANTKRDVQSANNNQSLSSAFIEDNFSPSHTGAMLRGKAVLDSLVPDGYFVDEFARPVSGKNLPNLQLQSSSSSPTINTSHSSQLRVQGRGLTVGGQLSYQPTTSANQLGRGTVQAQPPAAQRPVQTPIQPSLRPSAQQSGQRPGGPRVSSPSQTQLTTSSEVVEAESPRGSGKSMTPVSGKGKTTAQGGGRGSFLYSGAQVIGGSGSMGLAHGDQGFPGTPALLPVMQFGGQHPGGLGVPTVGMALPGYVAQQQLGFGNSEMTWVPVLAGAAGALGASYGPYFALDGSYYAHPPGQTSSSVTSSRETSTAKTANVWKAPQRREIVNDEFGQRQNKPRRYSEMNFGQ